MKVFNQNLARLLGMLTMGLTLLLTVGCQGNSSDNSPADQTTVSLSWTPPTTRSDGSELTDLSGYRLYYGTSQGVYSDVVDIDNIGITEYVFDNLPANTYYFVITAVDSQGVESIYSNEVSKTIG